YPLDFSFAVRRFLETVEPDAIALVELETWPNFIAEATARGIPVCILNGRLTQRSFGRYKLVRGIISRMFGQGEWFGIQTETIAKRFVALGAPEERVSILPTLKYDTADFSESIAESGALATAMGMTAEQKWFVGGSTGPGEEVYLLEAYLKLRAAHPMLR